MAILRFGLTSRRLKGWRILAFGQITVLKFVELRIYCQRQNVAMGLLLLVM